MNPRCQLACCHEAVAGDSVMCSKLLGNHQLVTESAQNSEHSKNLATLEGQILVKVVWDFTPIMH